MFSAKKVKLMLELSKANPGIDTDMLIALVEDEEKELTEKLPEKIASTVVDSNIFDIKTNKEELPDITNDNIKRRGPRNTPYKKRRYTPEEREEVLSVLIDYDGNYDCVPRSVFVDIADRFNRSENAIKNLMTRIWEENK